MRIVIFCHSLISDWNHGNAHFLRGVCTDLLSRGHAVDVYEPLSAWSVENLVAEHGQAPLAGFSRAYPMLHSHRYDPETLDIDQVLEAAQLVLVHEWNEHALVARLGAHRRTHSHYRLLFHDTHHRALTERGSMAAYRLEDYDGVLAYGEVLSELYRSRGWTKRAWTWHEAADTRIFRPLDRENHAGDLVWIGNWGDDERTEELNEFLLEPVYALGLRAIVHGVRYPADAQRRLAEAGVEYGGWLPNYEVPRLFSRYSVTVHVPRRPYVAALPGIPTIRVFEALACGIPLVSAPWNDAEGLFTPGEDFLFARDGAEMQQHLRTLLNDAQLADALRERGRRTVLERHTCAHRVDELLRIYASIAPSTTKAELAA